jgi:pimeloyl-ACP methyl ester carboxylesterase
VKTSPLVVTAAPGHSAESPYDRAVVSIRVDLDGPVHYLDFGGEGPPLVCVHGLAGSALNWMAVGGGLAEAHHVLAPDLRGFGRTPIGRGSRLVDNQRLLDRLLREVAGTPAVLVANSMGGLLAVRQAARAPETVAGLVLVDPALPWRGRRPRDLQLFAFFAALLTPGVGDGLLSARARRWGAERVVRTAFAICCAEPDRVPEAVLRAHIDQEAERLATGSGRRALPQAARSLIWALGRRGYSDLYRSVRAPVLLVHGDRDRLVPVEFSRAISRELGWPLEELPGVGHVPMLEAPDRFLAVTLGWLRAHRTAAA